MDKLTGIEKEFNEKMALRAGTEYVRRYVVNPSNGYMRFITVRTLSQVDYRKEQ